MTTPPTDKECEVILQWMQTYFDARPLEPHEFAFIAENYWRDEFDREERWTVLGLVYRYLNPLPESLEKLLDQLSSREA